MKDLVPYLQHIGNCGAVGSNDPLDKRCICGLRNVWFKLWERLVGASNNDVHVQSTK